jgi:PAS domain S-box-containing protein
MAGSRDSPVETVGAAPRSETRSRSRQRYDLLVDSVLDYAIFMLDPEGIVLSWNAGAARLKGYQAHEIVGRSFKLFYPEQAVQARWPDHELKVASEQGRFEDEGWRVRKDGSRFWANVVITRLLSEDGSLRGFAKVTRDLTERREHEETVRRSEEQFRLLLESVKDHAIFMLTPEGEVLTWNTGAQEILGWPADEIIGRHFSLFFTPEDVSAAVPAAELQQALDQGRAASEGWRVRKDASVFRARVVLAPVRDHEGRLRGFAKVTRDMSGQRRLHELEQASQRVSVFLAMLGHELRNPLAPIRNAVSLMQRMPELQPPLTVLREIMDRQVVQMTRLVDDLLDVGRVATGKIVLKRDSIDYRDVVLMSVEAVRPLLDARRHRIDVALPQHAIFINGDSARLTQALQNLLNNAAKYMEEGGSIELAVRVEQRHCITTVRDEGRGIAPAELEHIFTMFYQQDRSSSRDGGLGIGLSLARALVEAHGGRLVASSEGAGRGSTFALTLPLLRAEASAQSPCAPASGPSARARRVLVVDDNADSADTMAELLRLLEHDVRVAYGVRQAVEATREFKPELALVDLNMPDGDGFTLAAQLRALSARQPLYLAAMTGYAQETDRERTRRAGFDAHLSKPVALEDLQRLLANAEEQLALGPGSP